MDFLSILVSSDTNLRPSYFELASLDRLNAVLHDSLEYVLGVYAQRHPRILLPLARSSDGLYAILSGLVEWHYLSFWDSSFAENFYGLKRVSTRRRKPALKLPSGSPEGSVGEQFSSAKRKGLADIAVGLLFPLRKPANSFLKRSLKSDLTPGQKFLSLYLLVGHRYLSRKLEKKFEASDGDDSYSSRFYRFARTTLGVIRVAYLIVYICGKSRYSTPWQHLLGVQILRMTSKDFSKQLFNQTQSVNVAKSLGMKASVGLMLRSALGWLLESIKSILPVVLFGFKFLEWWYQSDIYKKLASNSFGAVPPPPAPPELKADIVNLPLPELCPICFEKRTNPAQLVDSGFVFCYPCIYKSLLQSSRCPVTGVQVKRDPQAALRRIYSGE